MPPSPSYADPSTPFSSVVENPDGTFLVSWDLGTLTPDTDDTITFTSLDRVDCVAGGTPTAPVVAGDTLGDTSTVTGTTDATCFTGTPASPTPDPDCSGARRRPSTAGRRRRELHPHVVGRADGESSRPLTKEVAAPSARWTAPRPRT